ncbi:hypothetical protein BDW02DRAFT_633260 [Decorospora gaudefroyi]|uniref:Rhodopsin domain-containing protein n=1 Tax=Decorospora gaudefroyi TaxID=184978 RepID=A0A6A5KBZ1_9PLEO|nr:hypothetical protein BDW02DRAFT_633260 [Decorospora gaudefroyi]
MGDQTRDTCIGVSVGLTILSAIIVALRLYTRIFIVQNTGKDDIAMVVALLLTIAYLIVIFVCRNNGMGLSGTVLTLDQMTTQIKATLAIEILYYVLITAIKVSIMFFYLRIAVIKRFEQLCNGTIYFLAIWCVVCIIVCFAQCIPLHKMWDLTGQVQGTCINTTAFFYTTSSIAIILDVWILALPVPTLLKVQRPRREKFGLVAIFGLGIFSCIASIVRLHSIRIYTESKDPFFDAIPINLWSMVEVNLGILCASIPATKALFSKAQRDRTKNGSYQYHSRERSITKGYEKGSGSGHGNKNSSAGIVVQNSFPLKNVESLNTRKDGDGAWRRADSDVDEQQLVWPESRV